MKYLVLLIAAIQLALHANCLPFPGVQIVKYRVPSKFFGQTNVTKVDESSSSLYNFLTQIHYGGTSHTIALDPSAIQLEDVSGDEIPTIVKESAAAEKTTNEYPEVIYLALIQPSGELLIMIILP
jgi:hypothetical protein